MIRRWILEWLGISELPERLQSLENTFGGFVVEQRKLTKRFEEVAQHFVIRNDTGMVTHSLADQYADEDGRTRPGPISGPRQWNTKKRFLEAQHKAPLKK